MAAAGGPSKSTLRWVQKEVPYMLRGLQLIFRSQLPYEVREQERECRKKCLQKIVGGGKVVDPSAPSPGDASIASSPFPDFKLPPLPADLRRLEPVAAGLKAFAALALKGQFPGMAGQVLSGGKLVPSSPAAFSPMDLFAKVASATSTAGVNTSASSATAEVTDLTAEEQAFLLKAVRSVNDKEAEAELLSSHQHYSPVLPPGYQAKTDDRLPVQHGHERRVPASRIARLATFGQLAVGLSAGAAAEVTRRALRMTGKEGASERVIGTDNPFLTEANAARIVATLCRVRGAALKLGQMLSIQDSDTVPQPLLDIFERVRHSADFMPASQVNRQMTTAFGPEWRSLVREFDEKPFAAASIGQVHRAVLLDGREVAVKIQYPGVAEGIDSDIDNLVSIISMGGLLPKGMFLDNFVKVARHELRAECDYEREARAARKFRELLGDSKDYYVPEIIDALSSSKVLTAEMVAGRPVDKCLDEEQQVRDWIAAKFIELCLTEIFSWRFMQTDPNWSNFLFGRHPKTGENRLILLDFGATRSYAKKFVDTYLRIISAAYEKNNEEIVKYSREIGFLTGYENAVMERAHTDSILILGETLGSKTPYDFGKQDMTKRLHQLIPVMIEHRLTSPPEEVYSLHRKLSGSYLLATKLRAIVSCGPIFTGIRDNYKFGSFDAPEINID